jgi:hypothetical protein
MRRAAIRPRRISSQFFPRSLRPYPTPTLKEIIASPSKIRFLIPDIYLYNRCGKKGAEKYGAKVSAQFGQAKFIGDTEGGTAGTGTDIEQRDRARSDYERIINQSKVAGGKDVWQGIRDRWTSALGSKYKQIVDQATSAWHAEHPKVEDKTVALKEKTLMLR